MPERPSVAAKVMVTAWFVQPDGAEITVIGAMRSIFRPETVADWPLSARSLTDPVADSWSPSPSTVLSAGHAPGSMPDSASEQVQATAMSPRYQPAPLGAVVAAPEMTGL